MNKLKIFYYSDLVVKKLNNAIYQKLFPGNIQLEIISCFDIKEIKVHLINWVKTNNQALIIGLELNDIIIPYTEHIINILDQSQFYQPATWHCTYITLFLITQLSYYKLTHYTNYHVMSILSTSKYIKTKKLI